MDKPQRRAAAQPRPFTSPKPKVAAERVFRKAAPIETAAIDRPARPLQRRADGVVAGAGAVSAAVGPMATVRVEATADVPRGSYKPKNRVPAPDLAPPVAEGPVSTGAPAAVRVAVTAVPVVPGPQRDAPNATRWRFPPERAPARVVDEKSLAAAAARLAAAAPAKP